MLDLAKLENARRHGAKVEARCPACAEQGADKTGNHLVVFETGSFGCIANVGSAGEFHRKRIWDLAGDRTTIEKRPPLLFKPIKPKAKALPIIPPLRSLRVAEIAQLMHLRGWSYFAGLQLLTNRGLLWYGDVSDAGQLWPAWIITDNTRRNAQARRLDGKLWEGIDTKAKTLRNCEPSWPIGAGEIGDCPLVVLCEGQPDFCAALLVAWWEGIHVAPVCMTGAGNSINSEALPFFAGKRVRIACHDDDAGRAASLKWSAQLYGAGAELVDRINFQKPVKDLADYAAQIVPEAVPAEGVFKEMKQI